MWGREWRLLAFAGATEGAATEILISEGMAGGGVLEGPREVYAVAPMPSVLVMGGGVANCLDAGGAIGLREGEATGVPGALLAIEVITPTPEGETDAGAAGAL